MKKIIIGLALLALACGKDNSTDPPAPAYSITVINQDCSGPWWSAVFSCGGQTEGVPEGDMLDFGPFDQGNYYWSVSVHPPGEEWTWRESGYIYVDRDLSLWIACPDSIRWE